jgi:predicted ABC-type ATPase
MHLTMNYDPDQPRDETGKWTSGGGGSVKTEAGQQHIPGESASYIYGTLADHRDAEGNWKPERAALHRKIIDDELAKGSPTGARILMMGGGTAAGKSSIVKQGFVDTKDLVTSDSDAVKTKLPEYQELVKQGDPQAAAYVHEESSSVAKQLIKEGLSKNYGMIMDGTGDGKYEGLEKKVAGWRAAGAKEVVAEYVTVPTEIALERARIRGEETGRFVAPDVLRSLHKGVSEILPRAVQNKIFDRVRLWDTNVPMGQSPKLVMEQNKGKTVIHDQAGWDAFLAKAKE